jgi:D-arabinose 1-dehydrogenase-like Zn-dependent alcohol dehydrogenase
LSSNLSRDFKNFIEFVNRSKLVPIIDSVRNYKEFSSAIIEMKEGKNFGKLVLTFSEQAKL